MKKLLILLLIVGCEETATEPTENFKFNLSVKDSSGEPLPNTEFYVRYRFMCIYGVGSECSESLNRAMPSTSIDFQIGEETFNSLFVYNLENEIVDTLIYGNTSAGNYSATLACSDCDPSYKAGVKVFRYVLESKTIESNEVIFRDSKYMVLINGARDVNQLSTAGITDESGNFHTDSKIWFPTLYNLPEFIGKDEVGNPTSNFYLTEILSDSIEIRVNIADSVFTIKHKIVNDINDIEIVIPNALINLDKNRTTLEQKSLYRSNYHFTNQTNKISSDSKVNIACEGFSLSQSYPNPFN